MNKSVTSFKEHADFRIYWCLGLLVILVYLIPYIILGEDAYITIHDFLDSNVAHQCTIIQLGLVGNPDGILPVMEGIPSLNYIPLIPLDVKTILYIILPTYWAIVVNILFVKVCAFTGMYLLLKNYVVRQQNLIALIVSICFALVPFYVDYGLSAAGIPLFLYAALNIEYGKKLLLSYIIVVFFSANSSLALSGLFICILWCGWIVYRWWKKKQIPKSHILGLLLIGFVYLFTNISIVYNFLFPSGVVSHRVEFGSGDFVGLLKMLVCYLLVSQYHAGSFGAFIILGITFLIFYNKRNLDPGVKLYTKLYILIVLLITLGCLVKYVPILSSFQFDRFYFLYPALCYILLAKALSLVCLGKKIIVSILILSLGSSLISDKEAIVNMTKLTGYELKKKPSFRQFEDRELFNAIKKDIGTKAPFSTKVACVGMFPSVAEMNQFYTVDSYVYSYPLDYKHRFRKVIAKELEKDDNLRRYFDEWGSRCYIYSYELNNSNNRYLCSKKENVSIDHLDINTEALKELGCDYILSAVNIENFKDLNLDFVNSYTTEESYWNIRVYRLL